MDIFTIAVVVIITVLIFGGAVVINYYVQQTNQMLESFSCDKLLEYITHTGGGLVSRPEYNSRC